MRVSLVDGQRDGQAADHGEGHEDDPEHERDPGDLLDLAAVGERLVILQADEVEGAPDDVPAIQAEPEDGRDRRQQEDPVAQHLRCYEEQAEDALAGPHGGPSQAVHEAARGRRLGVIHDAITQSTRPRTGRDRVARTLVGRLAAAHEHVDVGADLVEGCGDISIGVPDLAVEDELRGLLGRGVVLVEVLHAEVLRL